MRVKLDLTGRIALVTGGSGDLGRVISRTLASCGAQVVVHYHSRAAEAEKVVADIIAAGGKAWACSADLGDEAATIKLAANIRTHVGDPHIVVANAVVQYQPWASVLEQPLTDFDSQYRSCVRQAVLLAKAFAPAMQRAKGGRFIGLSTECAAQCRPGQSAYVSGKRGMDAVLKVLANELGPDGITVNQVAPGWMLSDRNRDDAPVDWYINEIPLRRRGHDQDVANAIAFLASDLASYITGTWLPVAGGHVMPTF